jgi:hypothetical protein
MVEPWEFEVDAQNTWQDAAQGADADGLGEHLVACSRTSKGPSKNEKTKVIFNYLIRLLAAPLPTGQQASGKWEKRGCVF